MASSFGAWRAIEKNEGVRVPHGLVFSLAVVGAIGRPHGLDMIAEEDVPDGRATGFDAVFVSVLDSRTMVDAVRYFRHWRVPFRRADRKPVGRYPLIWCGGQGLRNPLPLAAVYDLCVVGDAEDPLPELLALWERHGNTDSFLAAASTVPGVFVPDHHDPRETTIVQSVAQDISITLREYISVSHNDVRRVEIARGCKHKCTFCGLGWRTPLRENPADKIIAEVERASKIVHLQAGDAESHSEIEKIRAALSARGGRDQGWTGRYDSLLAHPDVKIPGSKRYAFGIEGTSYRIRRAVGKAYLTDDRLVDDTISFFEHLAPLKSGQESEGRAAWHVIAGWPTERPEEAFDLLRVVQRIDDRWRAQASGRALSRKRLAIHWQPLQPIPGTPAQWCHAGRGAKKQAALFEYALNPSPWLELTHQGGRTDPMALTTTILTRCDERGADLLEALDRGRVEPDAACRISGATYRSLDPDAPLPWDFISAYYPRESIRRAYDVMMRRLSEP